MAFKLLPIGVDDFAKLIRGNYYYVDKTLFIKELLDMKGRSICLPGRGGLAKPLFSAWSGVFLRIQAVKLKTAGTGNYFPV